MVAAIGVVSPAGAQLASQPGISDPPAAVSSDGLRWTPHRPRTTVSSGETESAERPGDRTVERLASADPEGTRGLKLPSQRSAASVVLDDGLARLRPDEPIPGMPPLAVAAPPRQDAAMAPAAASDRPSVAGPLRAGFGSLTLPQFPAIVPNVVGRRAPQGDINRSEPTGLNADRRNLSNAPVYRPTMQQRGARVAVNADGLPSVMAKSDAAPASDAIPAPGAGGEPIAPSAPQLPRMPAGNEGFDASGLGLDMGQFDPRFDHQTAVEDHGPSMVIESPMASEGMWMGGYPSAACGTCGMDECCDEECGFLPCMAPSGRFCAFLRQFGQPYYGWKWHRDLTASAGVTAFQTPADLGLFGNYGTNEYLNWAMPFWNAFGIGWQLGVRGVQTNFQRTTVSIGDVGSYGSSGRDQFFLTTGFFTRAFEGRGLQFGAAWDYLQDDWIDNVDVAQIRAEISYVWNVHEIGFWGAFQYDSVPFSGRRLSGQATTYELFNGFYRLQFGDANEWKVWGGASENGDGYLGTLVRAPMTRSLALEGTFAYLIPKSSTNFSFGGDSVSFTEAAWNISANVVFYPGCRSRRSLASPYRPLFDVADNGTMIRSIEGLTLAP